LNSSLEVTVILVEDHLVLLFQYVWFSIEAKMNLHGKAKDHKSCDESETEGKV
jgi:hypothetical protein